MTSAQKECKMIGEIGERYVMYNLSRLGISSIKLPTEFDFDIYTSTNIRIEVKTSVLRTRNLNHNKNGKNYSYKSKTFAFHNSAKSLVNGKLVEIKRDRKCDFFVLICMDNDFNIIKSYIIPKNDFGDTKYVTIYNESKKENKWDKFLEKWDNIILS